MVVFTCQHCNASLKRVVVSKHYATVCRRTPYLTCIDCLKDFHGDDYDAHMTCITENERYGDKNYKAKPTGVRQKSWIDVVHSCAELNKQAKYNDLFVKLATYDNIPRKRTKFMNFIKSCLPRYPQDSAAEVFDIIEVEFNKQKKADSSEGNDQNKIEKNPNESLGESKLEDETTKREKKEKNKNTESSDIVKNPRNGETFRKQKKAKRKTKLTQEEIELVEANNIVALFNKRSLESSILNDSVEEKVVEENLQNNCDKNYVSEIKLSKKELKKLKKKQKYEAELKNIEVSKEDESTVDVNGNGIEGEEAGKVSKKHKKRKATISESEADSGKKQKMEEIEENGDKQEEEEVDKPNLGKVKFNWEEIIKEILRRSSDNEMSIKRISKKVLAEYQAVKGNRESYEQLISKFNKKINKTVGVKVLKDKAKLISVE